MFSLVVDWAGLVVGVAGCSTGGVLVLLLFDKGNTTIATNSITAAHAVTPSCFIQRILLVLSCYILLQQSNHHQYIPWLFAIFIEFFNKF